MRTEEDAVLVRACRDGDTDAFGILVDRYQKAVFNAALRMIGDDEDARDIAQTVFLKAYENLAAYDPSYKFYSWIYRIAINESISFLNRQNRLRPLDEDRPSEDQGPEESFAGGEISRLVQEALMTLKADYRTVVVLRHFLNCSYEEISGILHVPEKTVKSRLFTARQHLKEILAQKGVMV